jgi:hypothetical protein
MWERRETGLWLDRILVQVLVGASRAPCSATTYKKGPTVPKRITSHDEKGNNKSLATADCYWLLLKPLMLGSHPLYCVGYKVSKNSMQQIVLVVD